MFCLIQFCCQNSVTSVFLKLNQYPSSIRTVSNQYLHTYLYQTCRNSKPWGCFCRTDTDLVYSSVSDPLPKCSVAFLCTDLDQIDYSSDSSHNIFSTGGEFSYFTELHAPTQAAHSYVFLIQQWVTKVIGRGNNPYWPLPSNDVVHGYEHWGCFTLCFTLHWWLVKTVTRIFLSVTVLTSFPDCGIDNMATDDNQMKWQQKTDIVCSLNENFSKSRSLSTV